MSKLEFNYTISVGNILTIFGGIVVAVMAIISIETANARRDEKLTVLDERVNKTDDMRKDIGSIMTDVAVLKSGQDSQSKLLHEIVTTVRNR